jgi:hypothetical protein
MLLAWTGGLLLAAWGIQYLSRPLGQDHGIFSWVGHQIVLGGLPYRDAWDIKGPLPYFLFALIDRLVGASPVALRLADLGIIGTGVFALRAIATRLGASPFVTSALLLAWYADLDYDDTAQPDGWAMALLALAVMLLLPPRPRPRVGRLLVFGGLIGLMALMKPTYAVAGILAPLSVPDLRRQLGQAVRAGAWAALGFAIPILLVLSFFGVRGGLGDLYEVHLLYNLGVYGGQATLVGRIGQFGSWIVTSPGLLLWVLAATAGVFALWQRNRSQAPLVAGWFLIALGNVVVQGKGFPYHFLPLVAPMALLAGIAATTLVRRPAGVSPVPRWAFPLGAGLLLAVLILPPVVRIARSVLRWTEAMSSPQRLVAYELAEYGFFGHADSPQGRIGAYVRERSSPTDRIQVWSMKAILYGSSGRLPPTRFGTSQPLVAGAGSGFRERYRTEFLGSIAAQPPRFVIARRPELCLPAARMIELECLEVFPEFARLVDARYRIATVIQDFAVWELVNSVPGGRQSSMR